MNSGMFAQVTFCMIYFLQLRLQVIKLSINYFVEIVICLYVSSTMFVFFIQFKIQVRILN